MKASMQIFITICVLIAIPTSGLSMVVAIPLGFIFWILHMSGLERDRHTKEQEAIRQHREGRAEEQLKDMKRVHDNWLPELADMLEYLDEHNIEYEQVTEDLLFEGEQRYVTTCGIYLKVWYPKGSLLATVLGSTAYPSVECLEALIPHLHKLKAKNTPIAET